MLNALQVSPPAVDWLTAELEYRGLANPPVDPLGLSGLFPRAALATHLEGVAVGEGHLRRCPGPGR
jgi:hypothetical protein